MKIEIKVKDVALVLEESANSEGEIHRMLDKCMDIFLSLFKTIEDCEKRSKNGE